MSSKSDKYRPKSELIGTFSGTNGRSYDQSERPVSVTSRRAVGEPSFATPRRGVDADELFLVATCGKVGATPVSFDMNHPKLLEDLSVSLMRLMADAKHNHLHGKR